MSNNSKDPADPGSPREQAPNPPSESRSHEENQAPPSYEDHIAELAVESRSGSQSYPQDVKSDDWRSGSSAQVTTNQSRIPNFNSGIPSPRSQSISSTGPRDHGGSSSHDNRNRISLESDHIIDSLPPPAYSEVGSSFAAVEIDRDGFQSKARVLDDGRVDISINQRSGSFANILLPALNRTLSHLPEPSSPSVSTEFEVPSGLQGKDVPRLNIVVQIIGSRGDVQPFVALGKVLKNNPPYHRVRIATHPTFHKFVEENGLEFFSVGGDPAELMAFMVKNPGLIPGMDSLRQGDVGKRRKAMYEMLLGFWRSCVENGNGLTFTDHLIGHPGETEKPFVADAIIANPPSFAHIHCAERLAIPLHLMFTMPWTPTQSFPHPLANIRSTNTEANATNFLSYTLVELLTWQGLGDLVNKFREKTLGLDPISTMWAPGMIQRLKVPYTYCWSPALIPKPRDWGEHIRISGFYFLDLANNYTPPDDLAAFLSAGPPPVYIGFGSIVVDDPNHLTNMIFDAIRITGVRALVSKGWGGLGGDALDVPENVFMLGNCPHDWLFKKVSCVVHHGGAGTTAIGVALGKPTVIVPFFGDQPFWGSMVHRAGAGPEPVPFKELTAEKLAESITTALSDEAQLAAGRIAAKIKQESGTAAGADSFHKSLDKQRIRCLVDPRRAAVWRVKRTEVRLSALAATFLCQQGLLDYSDLKLCRHQEWNTAVGPVEPISGAASALLGTIGSVMMGVGDFPREIFKAAKQSTGTPSSSSSLSGDQSTDNIAPTPTPLSAQSTFPSTQSGTTTPSRFDSRDSTAKDSEVTSLSSYESEHKKHSIELPELPELPGPPTPSESSHTPVASPPVLSHHESFHSHRSAMASALGVRRSRSNSPMRKLHKERPHPEDHDSHKLHKERSGGSIGETSTIGGQDESIKSPKEGINLEMWLGAGKGATRIAESVAKSPLDFTLALAQGFHNAPLLYGDTTVRQQEKITGIGSGLKVAGKEFAYGFYDGISGLVTLPYKGAKEEGSKGFFKGLGKGVGGIALKPGAAIWGLTGYTFKGIYEEYRKLANSDTNGYILAARVTQGYEELKTCQQSELEVMLKRWNALSVERVKGKGKQKDKTKEKEKDKSKKKSRWRDGCPGKHEVGLSPSTDAREDFEDAPENRYMPIIRPTFDRETMYSLSSPTTSSLTSTNTRAESISTQESGTHAALRELDNHEELEKAIQESVRQTSRGDPMEDRLIERALRASIAEVVSQRPEEDDDLVLRRAITASLGTIDGVREASDAEALEQAIKRSITETNLKQHEHDVDPDELALALAASREETSPKNDGEEDLKLALQISRKEEEEKAKKEKEEEEIVMNYVKKMSIAEQKYQAKPIREDDGGASSVYGRNGPGHASASGGESSKDAEQDELERAIQESLKYK